MIPKSIHFVWIGPTLPKYAHINIERFKELNPNYTVSIHNQEDLLHEFYPAYSRIKGQHKFARKSDLIRISVLLKYGGWYFDCDFLPFRPIDDIYTDYNQLQSEAFLTHGDYYPNGRRVIANGIIGVTKNHTLLRILKNTILQKTRANIYLGWGTFGPQLFTWIVEKFPALCTIGEIDMFYPYRPQEASFAAYRRMREANFADWSLEYEFGNVRPYMMHMSMQDALEIK